ncbi:glycine C-acetyltransferase [Alienimonas californiensis]|uniref:2-amino-3-ketobutyrate coenzyme A ligase n=1 Tax=Alienimonas californiensis TaxID=2527989 RepID=A0A517PBS7_9PLAN|nr:glycine C-acetyltransferase [Alienimonas californiensis]QDT16834.1 2-amino-3-ketobutyrate coenzyme A ligase [Alienimonas californiensis]
MTIAAPSDRFLNHVAAELDGIRDAGTYKRERVLHSPQDARVTAEPGGRVLNLCANNYLGLADHPDVLAAARLALDDRGYGMASVRFICGTNDKHKELEARLSKFLGTEDTILYPSCFDANGGLFEVLLGPEDAVISDSLNHASIIDGIRLCKAQRFRYANNEPKDLEAKLIEAKGARFRLIATDGVFSMDGTICDLAAVCELADKYDALVMFDDCHATGFLGKTGRGTHEHCGVTDRIDITTGTLGKALGGASGGYTAASAPIVELLRQRSRPYLFSNAVAPPIVAASLTVLDMLEADTTLRDTLETNTKHWRESLAQTGLTVLSGAHPITPVMLGDAALAGRFADALLTRGVYAIGFSYPVVPKGQARIRTQVSAAHTLDDLTFAAEQFAAVKQQLAL